MLKWIKTSDRLPTNQNSNNECNDYHAVKVEGYGVFSAMYMDGGWWVNYVARITNADVTHWLEDTP